MEIDFGGHGRVTLSIGEDGVAACRLARPDKLNALDAAMMDDLLAAGEALRARPGLRAVVLAGEGGAFCAGLDLAAMATPETLGAARLTERTHGDANRFQQLAMQWRDLPVPVIAAIHGVCFGGGLQIACGADIRVAAPDARLAIMELKWGIVPDMAGFALWRGLVRGDVLRELIYTHREFSGREAQTLGFATFVAEDPVVRATAIAQTIAARSPEAVRAAKRLANRAEDLPLPDILRAESEAQQGLLFTADQIEAVKSVLAGRPGQFGGDGTD